jgi:hypothetical protein
MTAARWILLATIVAGSTACASSGGGTSASTSPAAPKAGATDGSTPPGPPVIQVREFPASATVTVVAWDADDPAVGLRGLLNRDGTLVGHDRHGDHQFYLSTIYASSQGGFVRAMVESQRVLLPVRAMRDYDACWRGAKCSPLEIVGVRMPDAILRGSRDSLVVSFYASRGANWSVAVRRELIDAYLRTVDSVGTALRSNPVE